MFPSSRIITIPKRVLPASNWLFACLYFDIVTRNDLLLQMSLMIVFHHSSFLDSVVGVAVPVPAPWSVWELDRPLFPREFTRGRDGFHYIPKQRLWYMKLRIHNFPCTMHVYPTLRVSYPFKGQCDTGNTMDKSKQVYSCWRRRLTWQHARQSNGMNVFFFAFNPYYILRHNRHPCPVPESGAQTHQCGVIVHRVAIHIERELCYPRIHLYSRMVTYSRTGIQDVGVSQRVDQINRFMCSSYSCWLKQERKSDEWEKRRETGK